MKSMGTPSEGAAFLFSFAPFVVFLYLPEGQRDPARIPFLPPVGRVFQIQFSRLMRLGYLGVDGAVLGVFLPDFPGDFLGTEGIGSFDG